MESLPKPYPSTPSLCFEDHKNPHQFLDKFPGPKALFAVVYYVVLALQAVVSAGSYGEGDSELTVLTVQLGVIGGLGLFAGLVLAAVSVLPPRTHIPGYMTLLLVTTIGFSLIDSRFIPRLTDSEYQDGTTSFLPILCLLLASYNLLSSQYRNYILTLSSCVIIQLTFQLAGYRRATGVVDVGYTVIILWCFLISLHTLQKHTPTHQDTSEYTSVGKDDMEPENWGPPEDFLNTEFELIITELHASYQLITGVWSLSIPKIAKTKLKDALKRIFQAGQVLKSGRNIHEPIGIVGKQLDSEYKHYLEQNYLAPQVKEPRCKGPQPSDTDFNYEGQDLLPMLGQIEKNWNFDMFFLAELSGLKPLETTGEYCVKKYGLNASLGIEDRRLTAFLQALERKYKPNPYHNSTHAADVLNSLLYIFKHSPTLADMSELELLGTIIAALGHDVGHPAFNNRYLINTKSSFALIYNDQSVLENMHAALTTELMEQTKVLDGFSRDKWARIRRVTTDMILATDMMKHFDLVGSFRVKYADKSFPLLDFEDRVGLYKLCIKCADVGHAAKEISLHERWSLKVVEEFFHQGDLERQQGLEISAYCDRQQSDIPSSQSGFILNIVRPMYEALNSLLKSEQIQKTCIEQIETNIAFWSHPRSNKRAQTVKEHLPIEEPHTMAKSSSGQLHGISSR